jgi:hypothetical protein
LAIAFAVALAFAAAPPATGIADGSAALSQACAWEQYVDVYVYGEMDLGNISFKVSNQAAEVTDSGSLADKGVTVRTTLLIDASKSVPPPARENIAACVDYLIENIAGNEQLKIVAFSEQLDVLQDFTPDRYDLANAAKKIEFGGQQSKIYDAVYNTIPAVLPIGGEPCYYRAIVFTDGVDDAASGVTKEELYLRLQADAYPIDVVAVSETKQDEPEKELSALTRMSGGRYANLYPESDVSALSSGLAVGGLLWIRAALPSRLLDGSTRQVNISDGANSVQFDLKVSAFDVPQVSADAAVPADGQPEGDAEAGAAPAPDGEPAGGAALDEASAQAGAESGGAQAGGRGDEPDGGQSGERTDDRGGERADERDGEQSGDQGDEQGDEQDAELDGGQAEEAERDESAARPRSTRAPARGEPELLGAIASMFGDYALVVFVGAGVALVIIIAVIVALAAVRGKKKKQGGSGGAGGNGGSAGPGAGLGPGSGTSGSNDKTEYVGEASFAGAQFTIKLSSPHNQSRSWTLPISGELIVGRAEHCAVRLDDKSVSREQCKIVVQSAGLAVVHLQHTNKTFLNGGNVAASAPLQSGDTLKFGREVLRVDYIQSLGNPVPPREPAKAPGSGGSGTESIF